MVALVDNVPKTLSLREVIGHYVDHQREVVVRRTKYELRQKEARAHILEGLLVALQNLDAVIALIRGSRDPEVARAGLIERFELSDAQAQAILDLRLQRLTALEADKIREEHADIIERIRELREILGDESRVLTLIKDELTEIAEAYGDERRTEITYSEDDIDIEDLIADQQMVIAITKSGYVKSLPLATYRLQRRGGVGVTGMDMKDGDYIEHLFVSSTHDYLLFFTNRGKVYRLKVYELPEASRTAKGRALVNLLPLREGERVQSVLSTRDFAESPYLVFATRKGMVKKTELQAYNTPIKADGIIAINIRDDDELVAVRRTGEGDEIVMVSRAGQAVRFREDEARAMGRDTSGVRGMARARQGRCRARDGRRAARPRPVRRDRDGDGKRTPIDKYRETKRGAMGVRTIRLTDGDALAGGARRARPPGARVHLPERDGPAHQGARDQAARGADHPGRARDERARRRHRQRRRARRGVGRRHGCRGRRGGRAGRRRGRRPGRGLRRPRRRRVARARPAGRRARVGPSSAFATLARPEKGGGPHLSDSHCGTLEVSGR